MILKRKFLLFNFLLYIKKIYISEDNGISNSINNNTIINNNSHYSSLKSFKNYDLRGIPKHNGDDECDFFSDND